MELRIGIGGEAQELTLEDWRALVDVNILGGALEQVAGVSAGRLRLRLTGDERAAALAYLSGRGLLVEESP